MSSIGRKTRVRLHTSVRLPIKVEGYVAINTHIDGEGPVLEETGHVVVVLEDCIVGESGFLDDVVEQLVHRVTIETREVVQLSVQASTNDAIDRGVFGFIIPHTQNPPCPRRKKRYA